MGNGSLGACSIKNITVAAVATDLSVGRAPSILTLARCPMVWYIASAGSCGMILSFRDDWLREFFVNDVRSKKIPSDLEDRLFRKIQMIDDATTDRDLRSPPS